MARAPRDSTLVVDGLESAPFSLTVRLRGQWGARSWCVGIRIHVEHVCAPLHIAVDAQISSFGGRNGDIWPMYRVESPPSRRRSYPQPTSRFGFPTEDYGSAPLIMTQSFLDHKQAGLTAGALAGCPRWVRAVHYVRHKLFGVPPSLIRKVSAPALALDTHPYLTRPDGVGS